MEIVWAEGFFGDQSYLNTEANDYTFTLLGEFSFNVFDSKLTLNKTCTMCSYMTHAVAGQE